MVVNQDTILVYENYENIPVLSFTSNSVHNNFTLTCYIVENLSQTPSLFSWQKSKVQNSHFFSLVWKDATLRSIPCHWVQWLYDRRENLLFLREVLATETMNNWFSYQKINQYHINRFNIHSENGFVGIVMYKE